MLSTESAPATLRYALQTNRLLRQSAVEQLVGMKAAQARTLKCVERAFNSTRRELERKHASQGGDAIGSDIIMYKKKATAHG